ncbi:hypothetical protein CC1G_10404 [Coprinopsis cinerea okayama7|uniref:Uncharacterized protein n=1 Tax=Coprinopsis cinerea (strain Okayama-7 / 130 / ATCC MYA-4618 / FGSC 9003) TaxID=240176 RepID=A8PAN5_COPC7|nr:hypothetical protein CC1G_10404 [Coprinopsis cinerea okayama7\|eukprot:XP_001840020.2 hypothetical protein CC1G_10404 [Coprinopsis cinerea okayama7\
MSRVLCQRYAAAATAALTVDCSLSPTAQSNTTFKRYPGLALACVHQFHSSSIGPGGDSNFLQVYCQREVLGQSCSMIDVDPGGRGGVCFRILESAYACQTPYIKRTGKKSSKLEFLDIFRRTYCVHTI